MTSAAQRVAVAGNVLVALALVGFVTHAQVNSDLPQYANKAMLARKTLFPISIILVPGIWLAVRSRLRPRGYSYPAWLATLVVTPFVIDLAGNGFGWYNEITHFDDLVHFVNPVLLVLMVAAIGASANLPALVVWLMATGVGSTGHIVWELIEYWLLDRGANELGLSIADTLSDLGWGLVGALIGTALGLTLHKWLVPRRS